MQAAHAGSANGTSMFTRVGCKQGHRSHTSESRVQAAGSRQQAAPCQTSEQGNHTPPGTLACRPSAAQDGQPKRLGGGLPSMPHQSTKVRDGDRRIESTARDVCCKHACTVAKGRNDGANTGVRTANEAVLEATRRNMLRAKVTDPVHPQSCVLPSASPCVARTLLAPPRFCLDLILPLPCISP
jgi:hypothetical protein